MMDSGEAARRLGVRLPTLYAYVSRGRLRSHPGPRPGRSLFDAAEVEALARQARGGKQVEARIATVATEITRLGPDGPHYRDRPAVELSRSASFEQVAGLLWDSGPGEWAPLRLDPPDGLAESTRLRWLVVMSGSAHRPARAGADRDRVAGQLRTLIATLAHYCGDAPPARDGGDHAASVAGRVARRLMPKPTPKTVRALDSLMVLLADHELATSTLAVRVAASTRASVHDALLAGLGTLGGPLHGGAAAHACRLLYRSEAEGPGPVIGDAVGAQPALPGFGHLLYERGDPRAAAVLAQLDALPGTRRQGTVSRFLADAADRGQPHPNIDFALAAFAYLTAMTPDAAASVFTIARAAGWGAHYLEELDEPPLRYRARAIYTVKPPRGTAATPETPMQAERGYAPVDQMSKR
jgi:citrate synthase